MFTEAAEKRDESKDADEDIHDEQGGVNSEYDYDGRSCDRRITRSGWWLRHTMLANMKASFFVASVVVF